MISKKLTRNSLLQKQLLMESKESFQQHLRKRQFRTEHLSSIMAEEQLSPASAPWIFWSTLRGGYLTAAGMEDELLRLTIDESYEEDALTVDIWLNEKDTPVRAEILYDGRRILTMTIENFQIV